jgi:hypothetical protein
MGVTADHITDPYRLGGLLCEALDCVHDGRAPPLTWALAVQGGHDPVVAAWHGSGANSTKHELLGAVGRVRDALFACAPCAHVDTTSWHRFACSECVRHRLLDVAPVTFAEVMAAVAATREFRRG